MCPNCFCCRCKCGSKKKKPLEKDKENTGEDTVLNDQPYRYLTVDEMKSLGDDSLPIDVTRDERTEAQVLSAPPTADHDSISPLHASYTLNLTNIAAPDNVDIGKAPMSFGFLVSFLVDARGGAMRGCRHSGVRLIVPPRRAAAPTRVTCRYLRKDKLSHPPPLMEGEALASRILELGPVGAKFLGPVMIEVPHFASLRGTEREIVILRSDNGEAWREHTVEASEEVVQEILSHSYEKDEMPPPVEADPSRLTRILTLDFPHYFAVVSRVKQEVHAIGPEGGMVSSSVVPQVQAVFPQGALTKKIKVGLQAQPIPTDITAKLLGNRVAVSPIVTIEPRRRKFHKPITLTIPVPQAANKGMINQYSGDAPTLRLLCSITGGTARAQWEDVTGTTPLTFVKDCVSFTTTVSARFWLMDCRNVQDSAKMATELYREAIHVPFLAKFVVFAKRIEQLEARLRVFCMTDDKEDKTLEHQEHFTEVAKSRDVEVLEGKCQFVEFAGNLVPVTKSGDQLRLGFRAFRENRLPFTVRVKDPHADVIGRTLFMREPKVSKGEAPQQPICVLNIVLPEEIIPETTVPDSELTRYQYLTHSSGLESYQRTELRLSDISNLLENDWIPLASNLGISNSDISKIESDHAGNEAQQAMAMLKLWMKQSSNRPSAATLESGLVYIGREDIIRQCIHSGDQSTDYPDSISSTFRTTEFVQDPRGHSTNIKDTDRDRKLFDHAEIKESNIIEEPSKPVAEHRREIEKRLSQERSSSLEKTEKKSEELKMRTKITENVTLTETVAKDEPQLSFHDKRLSFERGNSQDRAKTDIFIQEEKKSLVITSSPLDTVEVKVDEAAKLSFKEKRKSFEQGSIEKSDKDDKKPKSDTKKVDEKIIEFRDELMSVPKHDKITENKHVSETLSKTVETTGDKKSIVSEKLTKTTEIKSDEKPITTELSRTTDQVERVEKPVVSEKKTKIIEEKDIVIIPGTIDTFEKLVSKPDVNETIETSFKVDPTYDMKAKIKTSKDDSVVSETITVMTDSKPIDEITVSVGSPKEKSGVSETVTSLTTGDKFTKEIINIEISNKNPVISETITTVIYDSKPTKELTKDKPVVGESTITVIPDAKPQTDINRTAVNEVITSVTTDKKPTEQAKAFEEIAEKIFKAESKDTEPIVFSSTGDKFDSRAVVTDQVSTKTESKPPDQIKEIKETTKPLTIETVTTVKAGENPLVSGTVTSVTATSKPTEEITTLSKSLEPAPEKESRIEEVAMKDTTEKISKDKSTGDLQNILKDGIQTTDSCIISEMITTKKMEGAPSETKTVTEITKKFSEKGKPDQQTVITEINTGKPDMSLEERRKSELFEGVTQGLLANVKNQEPKSKDIISPKLINTPPPSPADFKDATSVSSPTTDPSWTSSTTLTDKTAIFIESERGPKTTDKPLQDSYKESKTSISVLNDQSESNDINEHDQEAENIEGDITTEENNGKPLEQNKNKRKRKKGKGKNQKNSEKEKEIVTQIQSQIDISVDDTPVTISENISIIENIVEKNNKKEKVSKGIPRELLNATNIATKMILGQQKGGEDDSEISANENILERTVEKQSPRSNRINIFDNEKVNAMPVITEFIPKKFESAPQDPTTPDFSPRISDNDSISNNLVKNRDVELTGNSEGFSSFKNKNDLVNIKETDIIDSDQKANDNVVENFTRPSATNLKSSKNHNPDVTVELQNTESFIINDELITPTKNTLDDEELHTYDKSAVPHFMDSVGLYSSQNTSDPSKEIAFVTCDKASDKIPDNFTGTVKIPSEKNTSELPGKMTRKVISEKMIPDISDVIHGNSKLTEGKITTEMPNEIVGLSKILSENITKEISQNADGVSKVVTQNTQTTETNDFENDSQRTPSYFDGKNNTFISTYLKGTDNIKNFQSVDDKEELPDVEETNEISNDRFNDIIKNLSTSSREDIEQLLAGTLSQDPGAQDEKLTNLLIDMLIEQETMKLAASGDLPEALDSDGSDVEGTTSTKQTSSMSEKSVIDLNNKTQNTDCNAESVSNTKIKDTTNENFQTQNKNDKVLRTMVKENSEPVLTTFTDMSEEISGAQGNVSPKPYVTTPTLSRRGIGGSQRYSREERPMLIEVTKRYTSSSDEEDENDASENIQYVVTEPSPTVIKRKVTFKFDSVDLMSDDQEDERVHFEMVSEINHEKEKESSEPLNVLRSDSTLSKRNSIEIPKFDDLETVQKVERKFERMASETLEDNSLAKGAVEGEFQRLTSQLSHEEMDECLMIWNESDLDPMDGTKSEHVEFNDEVEDNREFENRDEPSSSQGYRKKKEESSEVDIKKSNDAPKK